MANVPDDIDGRNSATAGDVWNQRRDVSRFLHDTVSQTLVEISFRVSGLHTAVRGQQCEVEAAATLEAVHRCCRQVRLLSFVMASPSAAADDLSEAIEHYIRNVKAEADFRIVFRSDRVPLVVSPGVKSVVLDTVQEFTARTALHREKAGLFIALASDDSRVVLELKVIPEPPKIILSSLGAMTEGWSGIQRRAGSLGGSFDITFDPAGVSAVLSSPKAVAP